MVMHTSITFQKGYIAHRGETFRKALFKVGELWSLAHEAMNVMALTATATVVEVQQVLGMKNQLLLLYLQPKILFR